MTSSKTIIELPTKSWVDSLHETVEIDEIWNQYLSIKIMNSILIKKTNLDSITVNRALIVGNEISTKKYNDDELDENAILRFNQTVENYLRVSVGNDLQNLTKNYRTQIRDKTKIKNPNERGYLLLNSVTKCRANKSTRKTNSS